MSRIYTIPFTGTITNAGGNTDWIELVPATNKPVKLLSFIWGQSTEVGDASEEGLSLTLIRASGAYTSGSGGSTPTPAKADPSQAAQGFTVEANNTTPLSGGTQDVLEEWAWNERNSPCELRWDDEREKYTFRPTEALVIRMNTTPVDDFTLSYTLKVEEEG